MGLTGWEDHPGDANYPQFRMNWKCLRLLPGLDTRAAFVACLPKGGSLLDIGSSDGETLRHMSELRPDLKLYATDVAGVPEHYPADCAFHRGDIEREPLPWLAASMDGITCMHVIEHLRELTVLLQESVRLLKPGGCIYFETPHPKSLTLASPPGVAAGTFTLNFFDDQTHVKPVAVGALAQQVRATGLEPLRSGISRNWLFAAAYPFFALMPPGRKKFTALIHWIGWSAYLIARKPM